MAIRKIWGFDHLPSTAGISTAVPEYGFLMNPYSITRSSAAATTQVRVTAAEMVLSNSPGNSSAMITVRVPCTDLTDGVSRKSIIGFKMYYGVVQPSGSAGDIPFITIGTLIIRLGEIGLVTDLSTRSIEIVWDRVVKTVTVFVNGGIRLTKTVGTSVYTSSTVILFQHSYSNPNDSGGVRRYSNFYFIDDTEDDTICDRIGNSLGASSVLRLTLSELDNTSWTSTTAQEPLAVLRTTPIQGNSIWTVDSPRVNPSTSWGPVTATHTGTIPKYSQVLAVQTEFSVKKTSAAGAAAILDVEYTNATDTQLVGSLTPTLVAAGVINQYSLAPIEFNPSNQHWDANDINSSFKVRFQQRPNPEGAVFPPPSLIQLRKMHTYALVPAVSVVAKNISSLDTIYAMLNRNSKGTVFTASNLTILPPVEENYQGKNTKIVVAATPNTVGFSGTAIQRYNRVLIERAFLTATTVPTISANTTIYTILPSLNTSLGSKLTTDDIEDGAVVAGSKTILLVSKSTSYLFIPGSSVLVGTP